MYTKDKGNLIQYKMVRKLIKTVSNGKLTAESLNYGRIET